MTTDILIFIPDTLEKDHVGFLEGFSRFFDEKPTFYITNNRLVNSSSSVVGYCSGYTPDRSFISDSHGDQWIHLNNKTNTITINGLNHESDRTYNVYSISYDYEAFTNLDISCFQDQNYGKHFKLLAKTLQRNSYDSRLSSDKTMIEKLLLLIFNIFVIIVDLFLKLYKRLESVLHYSAIAVHIYTNAVMFKNIITKIQQRKKVTLYAGNLLLSKLVDIACGIAVLYFVVQYQKEIVRSIFNITEVIIHILEQLLNFLMGSPAGLKLNFALNRALGNFFLYHVSLWKAFLQAFGPLLKLGFNLHYVGALGLSFQAALVSDIITFSTFHVYCIYVYAARLYGAQIKGLISLWRLFIGRKYNPLRKRVDSHQYTHHQLFIGTLGFTVLLFLLPTTFIYYAVFTMLKVKLIALDRLLIRLRYILQCLPLYIGILWLINSSSIKGAIKLTVQNKKDSTIHATLHALSLYQCITANVPNKVINKPTLSWSVLFRNIVVGSLL